MNERGVLYNSFSPASRAICARWMFDDYTYLRQYTQKYLNDTAYACGFEKIKEVQLGSYKWNAGVNFLHKLIARFYTKNIFSDGYTKEIFQENYAHVYRKI